MSNTGDDILSSIGDEVHKAVAEKNKITLEALEHLWRSIPYGTEFELSNGITGKIEKFYSPKVREGDERLESGVDVILMKDGQNVGHIEFILYQSGWGMSLPQPVECIDE